MESQTLQLKRDETGWCFPDNTSLRIPLISEPVIRCGFFGRWLFLKPNYGSVVEPFGNSLFAVFVGSIAVNAAESALWREVNVILNGHRVLEGWYSTWRGEAQITILRDDPEGLSLAFSALIQYLDSRS
ncbi:MAG: hypothetical protein P1U58_17890 [Verrucomicrobiales bacterium]|nr:hypothetical protein [Verrucomicrobiales bacterium]